MLSGDRHARGRKHSDHRQGLGWSSRSRYPTPCSQVRARVPRGKTTSPEILVRAITQGREIFSRHQQNNTLSMIAQITKVCSTPNLDFFTESLPGKAHRTAPYIFRKINNQRRPKTAAADERKHVSWRQLATAGRPTRSPPLPPPSRPQPPAGVARPRASSLARSSCASCAGAP